MFIKYTPRNLAIIPAWPWSVFTQNRFLALTHSVLTAIFPGEPGLAGCPLNSPSPFIPGLRILLGHVHVILNTIPPGLFRASSLSNSFNLPLYTTFDPVIINFSSNMSKPSQPTLFEHQTDWFQSQEFSWDLQMSFFHSAEPHIFRWKCKSSGKEIHKINWINALCDTQAGFFLWLVLRHKHRRCLVFRLQPICSYLLKMLQTNYIVLTVLTVDLPLTKFATYLTLSPF